MSLRAAARLMTRMANASGVIADNWERAAAASFQLRPGDQSSVVGACGARGGGSGSGGASGSGGPSAGGSGGGMAGGGASGPLANREALWWLERLWYAQMQANYIADKRFPGGTIRRMSR